MPGHPENTSFGFGYKSSLGYKQNVCLIFFFFKEPDSIMENQFLLVN